MNRAERRRQEREARKSSKLQTTKLQCVTSKESKPVADLDAVTQAVVRGAERELERIKMNAIDEAVFLTFAIPVKVLMDNYWKKTYHKKLPEFVDYMMKYYEDWQGGKLDIAELKELLWNEGGIKFEHTK